MNCIAIHIYFAVNVSLIWTAVWENSKAEAEEFAEDNWVSRDH